MKKFTKEEFDNLGTTARKKTKAMKKAEALVIEFLESDEDIVEIEESDFDGMFEFDDQKQRTKAAGKLRNVLMRNAFRDEDVAVKGKANRLFLVKPSVFNNRSWRFR